MDQLPRLGKRELICVLLFTCNYVVSVWRCFFFLWVLGMGYVIFLWDSLSLPYNYLYYEPFHQVVQSAPPVWENHLNRTAPYGYLGEFKAGQRVAIQLDATVCK